MTDEQSFLSVSLRPTEDLIFNIFSINHLINTESNKHNKTNYINKIILDPLIDRLKMTYMESNDGSWKVFASFSMIEFANHAKIDQFFSPENFVILLEIW